jgi:Tol biopolymer transport system component
MKTNRAIIFLVFVSAALSLPAEGAGFGKNKVEYRHFSWHCYKIPHFEVYFSQNQGELPALASQWIENSFASLRADFHTAPKDRVPLIIFDSPSGFGQTNIVSEILPEGVGGFTTQIRNRIVVPFDGSVDQFRHVLHHELVHAFEYSILYDQLGSSIFSGSQAEMPLWFAEGLAEYLSTGWNTEADMFLMDATIFGTIPLPGPELDGYMAYKGGQSFLYYAASSRGEKTFTRLLTKFKESKNIENSFKFVYGKTAEELGEEWKTELKRLYWPEIGRRTDPAKNSIALTSHTKDHSNFNLKPRISPDGTRIAYYSDIRDYTRILIRSVSGKTLHEISETGFAGSFESFHPFRSGMCWSPAGDRLAFVTSEKGRDLISIIDAAPGHTPKRIRTLRPDVTTIYSPDWSPDGNRIVFCAVDKGKSDLFLYDLGTDTCTRLTDDILSEADPRFTRDGKSVVFSCQDTCGNAARSVRNGPATMSQLWRMDIASKQAKRLTFSACNKKSPCFSPDGARIMYVSDANGIDNLYVAPIDKPDSARAITDVLGGISNPDWAAPGGASVGASSGARDSAAAVYCLFQKGGWDIWRMKQPLKKLHDRPLEKTKWAESLGDTSARYFAPSEDTLRQDSAHTGLSQKDGLSKEKKRLRRMDLGAGEDEDGMEEGISERVPERVSEHDTASQKPAETPMPAKPAAQDTSHPAVATAAVPVAPSAAKKDTVSLKKPVIDTSISMTKPPPPPVTLSFDTIPAHPYRLKFAPDMIALGVGTDAYYGYGMSGQWLAVFSDLMGNQQIAVMGDIEGNVTSYTHLFASYLNLERKVNYGGGLFYNREYTNQSILGDTISFDQDGGVLFTLSLPFSMTSRIDLQGYFENLLRTPWVYNDAVVDYVKDPNQGPYTINIFTPSLSYVYDDILWGITGPLNGIRGQARLQVSPPLHALTESFASVDVDFRKYFHLWHRFVWANKVAFGGSVSLRPGEPSAKKFFLGGNEYWIFYGYDDFNSKGYKDNINNFIYSDMIVPFRGWGYLDLIGTKFAVFNTEFRFPFIKEFSLAWPLPLSIRYVTGAVFADAGNAWDKEQEFPNFPLPKKIYGGFGYGLRANLGIFILRYDHAWKTDWNTFAGPTKEYFSLGAEY